MKYFDSNFFIYAVVNDNDTGNWCRKVLGNIMEGEIKACTSTLTWDEIVYVLMKKVNTEIAYECSEYLLSLPNLQYIDVTPEILTYAHSIMVQHHMKPRDAIHTACLYALGISTIISEDTHFDKIPSINRIWMEELV